MALLTVTEAARLTRRSRTSIYRDLEKGRLDKVYTADGSLKIDSAELARAYGPLDGAPAGGPGASPAATHHAIHAVLRQVAPVAGAEATELAALRERLAASEHRNALLERIAGLEKAARLAADASWRERIQAKDDVIAALTTALSSVQAAVQANAAPAGLQPNEQPAVQPDGQGPTRRWAAWHRPGAPRAVN